MGSIPYPLNLLKYRIVCESHFWLSFDKEHMIEAQSKRTLFLGGSLGSIHLKAEQKDLYDPNQIISYAEKNGWIYGGKLRLAKEDFSKFFDKLTDENHDLFRAIHEITGYIRSPLWIKENCTVLAFDTGQANGLPSYIMIKDDRSEVAVYANHGLYPDGPYPFTLPPLFKKAE
jgi:hypothetical protein